MKIIDLNYVVLNIRRMRESLAYSQEYMGMKLGMGQNAYSKIELGKSKLTLDRLFGIAHLLGTDVFTLLKEIDDRAEAAAKIEMVA